ncbi:MAG: aryl-alcohol dehydrogenase-like predicted oxidoreductase [Motiliproteus sp.]|jgi:aryl-alcohol dehydrogenase-like predicted oxidoreductase
MVTRKVGPFDVSALGLGCMNMSSGYGAADDDASEVLLLAALDAGYRFFDTAAIYGDGHNERLLGRVLKKRRQEFVLATKGGLSKDADGSPRVNGRPQALKLECEQSLRRLQTEVIDLYYLHRLDPDVPVEESVGALADLQRQGKIRALGLSEVSTATLRRAHREHPIGALQSEYSLWSRTPERSILAVCAELEIGFVPFSPLARGFLTGGAGDVNTLGEGDIRVGVARPRFEPHNFAANSRLLVPMRDIAAQQGCTLAQLALAWLLARSDKRLVPIPGTKHLDFMRENALAAELELSVSVVDELDQLINEETVAGARYTEPVMETIDSECDFF